MGIKNSKNAEYQRLRAKFDNKEVAILQQAFQDLAHRSRGKTIDKLTFTKVFQLPGILGDRLFSAFDRKQIGAIDWEEFIGGLGLIVRGNHDEKIDFLFRMYDLNGVGYVTRTELTTMLNSVVFAAYIIADVSLDGDKFSEKTVQELNEKVQLLVVQAFEGQNTDRLSKEQFKQWVVEHSETLDFLELVFQTCSATGAVDRTVNHQKRPSSIDKEKITFDGILHSASPALSPNASFRQALPNGDDAAAVNGVGGSSNGIGSNGGTLGRATTTGRGRLRKASSILSGAFMKTLGAADPNTTTPRAVLAHRHQNSEVPDSSSPGLHMVCQACHYVISIRNCAHCGKALSAPRNVITCRDCCSQGREWACAHCLHCGFDLALNDKPLEPLFGRGLPEDGSCQIEGWLYKIGSMFKTLKHRWFMIKDNFLYTFHSDKDVRPTGLLCLEGCFVEPVDHSERNGRMRYGIEVSMPTSDHTVSRFFYARDEQSQIEWCVAFRHAARQFVLEDYYDIGVQLGTGKFSSVCGCTHKVTGKKYAVKIIDKSGMSATEREMLRTEIAVLQLVHHPNVIHLKNVFETRTRIYIITTLVEGGDLFERIMKRHRFTESAARSVFRQLLSAVQYLHERGIVHRDLKPENIMMSSPDSDLDIQVADFGLSKFAAPNESMSMPCGTLAYVAPEVLTQVGYGKEVDLWSVGVVLYVLLRGRLPFDAKTRDDMIDKTIQGRLPMEGDPVWANISDDAKDLIRGLLCPDPRRRLSVDHALTHAWLRISDTPPASADSGEPQQLPAPDNSSPETTASSTVDSLMNSDAATAFGVVLPSVPPASTLDSTTNTEAVTDFAIAGTSLSPTLEDSSSSSELA